MFQIKQETDSNYIKYILFFSKYQMETENKNMFCTTERLSFIELASYSIDNPKTFFYIAENSAIFLPFCKSRE